MVTKIIPTFLNTLSTIFLVQHIYYLNVEGRLSVIEDYQNLDIDICGCQEALHSFDYFNGTSTLFQFMLGYCDHPSKSEFRNYFFQNGISLIFFSIDKLQELQIHFNDSEGSVLNFSTVSPSPILSQFDRVLSSIHRLFVNKQITCCIVFLPEYKGDKGISTLLQKCNLEFSIMKSIGLSLFLQDKILSVSSRSGSSIYDEISLDEFKTIISNPGYFPFRDLKGVQLNVVEPAQHIVQKYRYFGGHKELPTRDLWAYSAYLLFRDLKTLINFTENPVAFQDGKTYINSISDGEADLEIFQRIMEPNLTHRIQYLQATYAINIRLFFTTPSSMSMRNIYLAPFTLSLWLATVLTLGFVIIFTIRTARARSPHSSLSKGDVVLSVIAAACQQGWHLQLSDFKLLAVRFGTLVTTVSLYTMYCAVIISQLTSPVDQIKELVDFEKFGYVIAYPNKSAEMRHLTAIEATGRHDLKVKMIDHAKPVLAISSSKLAFLSFPANFYDAAKGEGYERSGLCQTSTSVLVDTIPYAEAFVLRKGLPYREIFNQKIHVVKERGLFHRYISHYNNGLKISCLTRKVVHPVTYAHCISAYVLVGCGIVGAIALLVLELSIKNSNVGALNLIK